MGQNNDIKLSIANLNKVKNTVFETHTTNATVNNLVSLLDENIDDRINDVDTNSRRIDDSIATVEEIMEDVCDTIAPSYQLNCEDMTNHL